eukprot:403370596
MNEGDIAIVFSQFGEVVDCRLARDQKTGKSKGFAFLAYEDQKSTVLAVDNLNGIDLCGRLISVDHVMQYKIPREYLETDQEKKKKKEREKEKAKQTKLQTVDAPVKKVDADGDLDLDDMSDESSHHNKHKTDRQKKQQNEEQDNQESGKDSDDEEEDSIYEGMDEEEIAKIKWEKKLYKPSGPDGKGWGDFRQLNENDLNILQEFNKFDQRDQPRIQSTGGEAGGTKIDPLAELTEINKRIKEVEKKQKEALIVVDEDQRWEMQLREQMRQQEAEDKRRQKEEMREQIESLRKLIEMKEKSGKKKSKKEKKDKKDKKSKKDKKKKRDRSRDKDDKKGDKQEKRHRSRSREIESKRERGRS